MYFGGVERDLFDRIYQRCVRPGTPCMGDMMRHDDDGGHMPSGRNAPPPHGGKPEGAIFREGEEKGTSPNVTKPRQGGQPGSTEPASKQNRDMSQVHPHAVPGKRPAADGAVHV